MKAVLDLEANGLLDTVDTIWHIVCKEVGVDNYVVFSDHAEDNPNFSINEFPRWADENLEAIIAHNGVRYDMEVLYRLLNWEPKESCKIYDTLIMSKMNNFIRPQTKRRHSLKEWGKYLGHYKVDYDGGFDAWHPDMLPYCKVDCEVTEHVYNAVLQEFKNISAKKAQYSSGMRTEHDLSTLSAQMTRDGWLFDFDACQLLIDKITNEMLKIEETVEPELNDIERFIDSEPKSPKYKKDGTYNATTCRILSQYLGYTVSPEDALKAEPPMKPEDTFRRSETIKASLGNQDVVKDYLYSLGWKPDEWNWKNFGGQWVKQSPKFTEKSLLAIGHRDADFINDYYTLRSRRSVLQGFMNQKDGDGRLRGDIHDMGAASFRQSHKIIANLPGAYAKYGEEIRSLFICPEGKTIISADGAAYQIRILCHYLKSEEYTDVILNGDAHQRHADIMGITRNQAKGVFFAFLFGAGNAKIANMLDAPVATGKEVKEKLLRGVPGMSQLINKIKGFYNSHGYIPGIDGRKVFPESDHKALNYLIQSTEAILMKRTWVRICQQLKQEGIEYKLLLTYHDELSIEINETDTERATEIMKHWFAEAPKELGVDIMEAGDVLTGSNYFEVH